MTQVSLKIAIISDLHCHPKRSGSEGKDETYLLTDKLRVPGDDHPVESLLEVIKKNKLRADLTLCPGDFTDKANIQGFISGWDFSNELHKELKSKEIIATLGNHDVDVYNTHSDYSLNTAQAIKKGFPIINEEESNTFWGKGCVFVERKNFRVLVINSSHFHHNKASAVSGKVGDNLLEYVRKYLNDVKDNKIQIALSHHHPIDHSRMKLGEEDKIVNADALLDILGQYKFDLFVHGHKHDPLLRYHPTNHNHKIPILSSGSFSSASNLMFTSVRNNFHLLEITKNTKTTGEITTYTFFPNSGWQLNYDAQAFGPQSGFGSDMSVDKIYQEIIKLLDQKNNMLWSDLINKIPQIKHLIPSESVSLYDKLISGNYRMDKHICDFPTYIFNVKT